MVLKRLVAVAKAQGSVPEAIQRCNEYLTLFASDTQAVGAQALSFFFFFFLCLFILSLHAHAYTPGLTVSTTTIKTHQPSYQSNKQKPQWQELAELYLLAEQPALAAFCYEELLLFQPSNFAFHTALAEAYYSTAGAGAAAASGYVRTCVFGRSITTRTPCHSNACLHRSRTTTTTPTQTTNAQGGRGAAAAGAEALQSGGGAPARGDGAPPPPRPLRPLHGASLLSVSLVNRRTGTTHP